MPCANQPTSTKPKGGARRVPNFHRAAAMITYDSRAAAGNSTSRALFLCRDVCATEKICKGSDRVLLLLRNPFSHIVAAVPFVEQDPPINCS